MRTLLHVSCLLTIFLTLSSGSCRKDKLLAACVEPKASYDLKAGEQLYFCLDSNPTTGYSWAWLNRAAVRTVDSVGWVYTPDAQGVVGGGGRESWVFTARLPGRDTLKFGYRRPWEPGAPVRERSVIVVVR
jgi:predicted secreted protein